jgi:hypothetical protein
MNARMALCNIARLSVRGEGTAEIATPLGVCNRAERGRQSPDEGRSRKAYPKIHDFSPRQAKK